MTTKRDRVWSAALELAREAERPDGPRVTYGFPGFTVEHVAERLDDVDDAEPVSVRMTRDTLNSMVELGVLSKKGGSGRRFAEYRRAGIAGGQAAESGVEEHIHVLVDDDRKPVRAIHEVEYQRARTLADSTDQGIHDVWLDVPLYAKEVDEQ